MANLENVFIENLNKGKALFESGQYDKALVYLERAYRIKPEDMRLLNMLGMAYFRLDQLDEAVQIYELLARKNPNVPILFSNMGLIKMKRGDLDGAETAFLRVIELQSDNKKVFGYLGLIAEKRGEIDLAIEYYEKANAEKKVQALKALRPVIPEPELQEEREEVKEEEEGPDEAEIIETRPVLKIGREEQKPQQRVQPPPKEEIEETRPMEDVLPARPGGISPPLQEEVETDTWKDRKLSPYIKALSEATSPKETVEAATESALETKEFPIPEPLKPEPQKLDDTLSPMMEKEESHEADTERKYEVEEVLVTERPTAEMRIPFHEPSPPPPPMTEQPIMIPSEQETYVDSVEPPGPKTSFVDTNPDLREAEQPFAPTETPKEPEIKDYSTLPGLSVGPSQLKPSEEEPSVEEVSPPTPIETAGTPESMGVSEVRPVNLGLYAREQLYIHPPTGSERFLLLESYLLEVVLSDRVYFREGSLVAFNGNLFFDNYVVMEDYNLVQARGLGILFLSYSRYTIHLISLNEEKISISIPNFLVAQASLKITPKIISQSNNRMFPYLEIMGTGTVGFILKSKPLDIKVMRNLPAVVNSDAVVAWSGSIQVEAVEDPTIKELVRTYHEMALPLRFQGAGDVIVEQGALWGERRLTGPVLTT